MNKFLKQTTDLVLFQPLLVELGLDDQPIEFQNSFIADLQEKFDDLIILKLSQLLSEEEMGILESFETEEDVDSFLQQKNINFEEVVESVGVFLKDHLMDYKDGLDEYLNENDLV